MNLATILIFSDYQTPHHDKAFHQASLEYAESCHPTRIIFNGDGPNLDAIKSSKYKSDPLNDETVQSSLHSYSQIIWDHRRRNETAELLVLEGNHEARWMDWLMRQAPEVQSMAEFDLGYVLHLDEMGAKLVRTERGYGYPHSKIMLGPHLEVTHGWMARRGSGASVRAMLDSIGYTHSLVVGHTHRVGMVARTKHEADGSIRTVMGIEGGCMCDIGWGLGYARTEDWQNGFVRVEMRPDGLFTYRPVIWDTTKKELFG